VKKVKFVDLLPICFEHKEDFINKFADLAEKCKTDDKVARSVGDGIYWDMFSEMLIERAPLVFAKVGIGWNDLEEIMDEEDYERLNEWAYINVFEETIDDYM
jgi:hypothetical protein